MALLNVYNYRELSEEVRQGLLNRNTDSTQDIVTKVQEIMHTVQLDGDAALRRFSQLYDGVDLDALTLEGDELQDIAMHIGRNEQRALEIAFSNIHRFHSIQTKRERTVETMPGVRCWRENRPIDRVGLYVPGGTAVLPSTLLMLGVPARIAGCKEIIVCSPPQKDGLISPAIAYCLQLLKIEKIYLIGGAQAIAAMAYGTESVPQVDKIFGPGNQYVTQAKLLVQSQNQVAIDMPAGPSEVLIIADASCHPGYIAADLLAQAEHGPDSQAVLVSTSPSLINEVNEELAKQLPQLPRQDIARQALSGSYAVLCEDMKDAMSFSNDYAPEHLILAMDDFKALVPQIAHAGSVFLGRWSPESVGDYASGTNHTLPTSRYARAYSGVSTDSFMKKITFQHLSQEGLEHIGSTVETLAELEGLQAHKHSVRIRLADSEKDDRTSVS